MLAALSIHSPAMTFSSSVKLFSVWDPSISVGHKFAVSAAVLGLSFSFWAPPTPYYLTTQYIRVCDTSGC